MALRLVGVLLGGGCCNSAALGKAVEIPLTSQTCMMDSGDLRPRKKALWAIAATDRTWLGQSEQVAVVDLKDKDACHA